MSIVLLCMGVGRSFPRGSLPHPTHIFSPIVERRQHLSICDKD